MQNRKGVSHDSSTRVQKTERWGDLLLQHRARLGISLRELARLTKISPATLHRWEGSNYPNGRIDLLLRLQWVLGLDSIEQVLGGFSLAFPSADAASREASLASLERPTPTEARSVENVATTEQ